MAITNGVDYIYGRGSCCVDPQLGEGIILGTHKYLLMMPVFVSDYEWDGTKSFSFRSRFGDNLESAIEKMLSLEDFGERDVEEFILAIGDEFEEAVLHHLAEIKRFKFRNGFFARGIYLNKNERGRNDWLGHNVLDKDNAQMFQDYYSNTDVMCKMSSRMLASSY